MVSLARPCQSPEGSFSRPFSLLAYKTLGRVWHAWAELPHSLSLKLDSSQVFWFITVFFTPYSVLNSWVTVWGHDTESSRTGNSMCEVGLAPPMTQSSGVQVQQCCLSQGRWMKSAKNKESDNWLSFNQWWLWLAQAFFIYSSSNAWSLSSFKSFSFNHFARIINIH